MPNQSKISLNSSVVHFVNMINMHYLFVFHEYCACFCVRESRILMMCVGLCYWWYFVLIYVYIISVRMLWFYILFFYWISFWFDLSHLLYTTSLWISFSKRPRQVPYSSWTIKINKGIRCFSNSLSGTCRFSKIFQWGINCYLLDIIMINKKNR